MPYTGHICDCCGGQLVEEDYTRYGSWSYDCRHCGFKYRHGSSKTVAEQVDDFKEVQNELDELYEENIDDPDNPMEDEVRARYEWGNLED